MRFSTVAGQFAFVAGLLATLSPVTTQGSPAVERIVAIGDLHGDLEAYHGIIRAASLVDEDGRWAGGRTILVQTGDIADRGPNSRSIIIHLRRLQRQAERAGGQVIALVGNHEAMNMIGDLRYVHPGEYLGFVDRRSRQRRERTYSANQDAIRATYLARQPGMTEEEIRAAWMRDTPLGALEHRAAWHPEGQIGSWVARNPAAVLIQGNLFVHGGISPAYASVSVAEINSRTREALIARDTDMASIINDPVGPLWHRGNVSTSMTEASPAQVTSGMTTEEIDNILQAQGARRLIVGHTPLRPRIQVMHGGRLILIDTGISAAYGSNWSYLEILNGQLTPHSVRPQDHNISNGQGTEQ